MLSRLYKYLKTQLNVNYICTPQNNTIAKATHNPQDLPLLWKPKSVQICFLPRRQNTKGNPVEYANNITMHLLHVHYKCELLRFESVRVDVIF